MKEAGETNHDRAMSKMWIPRRGVQGSKDSSELTAMRAMVNHTVRQHHIEERGTSNW
jgi:hypothetical protein